MALCNNGGSCDCSWYVYKSLPRPFTKRKDIKNLVVDALNNCTSRCLDDEDDFDAVVLELMRMLTTNPISTIDIVSRKAHGKVP